MKIFKSLVVLFLLMLVTMSSNAQDKRTMETKVADLLAQLPASNTDYTNKLMRDMISLGEQGITMICNQIVPPGTGDDTKARFAVESLSRFLSKNGVSDEKSMWEKICIGYATGNRNNLIRDFFIRQLQQIGSDASVEALKGYLGDKDMCEPALAAILSIGGKSAETAMAESLRNKELPCAAAVMNDLAKMRSGIAVEEYIEWSHSINVNTKAAALHALAESGSPEAYPVLLKAARDMQFRWEHSGATAALLDYAENSAANGDTKTMDRICKLVISKCNDKTTIQNKAKALAIYVRYNEIGAMKELIRAAGNSDKTYRNAAFQASLGIPGEEIVNKWIGYFPQAIPEAKPEIIEMLGIRGDKAALPLIAKSLSDKDAAVRTEAAAAIAKMDGIKAVPGLIEYLKNYTDSTDQKAACSALETVSGRKEIALLRPLFKEGPDATRTSVINLMAWSRGNEFLADILPYATSSDKKVRTAACDALQYLAGPSDQEKLIGLLSATDSQPCIEKVQDALASAANKMPDPDKRSDILLKALNGNISAEKIIPVLAKTGGREALDAVMKEFENGKADMRDICFRALTSWKDYSASYDLYDICASGNKTYEEPAFKGYIDQVRETPLTDEEKLLLYRKIMPYARSAERKNEIIDELAKLKTYQTLFFVAGYLDDPETASSAADAVMHIALPSVSSKAGMYGTLVREILTKAMTKLSGPEAQYNREMISKYLGSMPQDEGFKSMFNGKDLTGWQGLVENPVARAKMSRMELERKQAEANLMVPASWSVKDGCIWFNGKGDNLCSVQEYGNFELLVDWKITKDGDSGIYLRGTPQVQIWDTSRTDVGAQVGSGGLYNNEVNPSKPLKVADNPVGEWNSFRIIMINDKVSVWLNGEKVVDSVTMENYWDRKIPIFPKGPVELQAHGTDLGFRDIYIMEISDKDYNITPEEKSEGFVSLFNGRDLNNWVGNKHSYAAENGMIVIKPENGSGGNLYTEKEYADFIFRFDFQLTPAANNGIGIRAPLEGDAAYVGMEIQILDNSAPVYANLQPYQYHGSVYGVIPAKRGYLKPVGEWNSEEISAIGTHIKVTLNGTVIVDGDIAGPRDNGTMDHNDHPGLKNKTGHIGFLGHGSVVRFRNIRIKDLTQKE